MTGKTFAKRLMGKLIVVVAGHHKGKSGWALGLVRRQQGKTIWEPEVGPIFQQTGPTTQYVQVRFWPTLAPVDVSVWDLRLWEEGDPQPSYPMALGWDNKAKEVAEWPRSENGRFIREPKRKD